MSDTKITDLFKRLPFVDVLESQEYDTKVRLLCRVKAGTEKSWAKVVENILKSSRDTEQYQAHICRLYFLKGDTMVYGWHIEIVFEEYSSAWIQLVLHFPSTTKPKKKSPLKEAASYSYSPPLNADDKGNPIISGNQVMSMPFTGMEGRTDRNIPTPPGKDGRGGGKGANYRP